MTDSASTEHTPPATWREHFGCPDCDGSGWWWCEIDDGERIKQRCTNAVHESESPSAAPTTDELRAEREERLTSDIALELVKGELDMTRGELEQWKHWLGAILTATDEAIAGAETREAVFDLCAQLSNIVAAHVMERS